MKTSSKSLQRNNFSSSETSWRRFEVVMEMSWRSLENILEDKKLLRWRYLQDVFKACLQEVFKTCLQDVFKTFTGNVYWEYLYLKNLKSASDKSISPISNLTNQGESKMHWLVPNDYDIYLILKLKQHFYFKD